MFLRHVQSDCTAAAYCEAPYFHRRDDGRDTRNSVILWREERLAIVGYAKGGLWSMVACFMNLPRKVDTRRVSLGDAHCSKVRFMGVLFPRRCTQFCEWFWLSGGSAAHT
uniref:Uncharacterized protein n=1 Tax=Ixodes ricinus TaxID=34613 RepID=A0A0K8R4U7_IXORI